MAYWPPPPPTPPQLHHKSLHMDIQLFVGNLYVSNKSEDSIPQLLPWAHVMYIVYVYILYMYVCIVYTLSTLYLINIISYNSCNYNHNIQFLNFILTVFQTSWGWLVMLDPWCRITFLTSNTTFKYSTSTLHNIYYSYDLLHVFSRGSINLKKNSFLGGGADLHHPGGLWG